MVPERCTTNVALGGKGDTRGMKWIGSGEVVVGDGVVREVNFFTSPG
jgi:hypothetical protein